MSIYLISCHTITPNFFCLPAFNPSTSYYLSLSRPLTCLALQALQSFFSLFSCAFRRPVRSIMRWNAFWRSSYISYNVCLIKICSNTVVTNTLLFVLRYILDTSSSSKYFWRAIVGLAGEWAQYRFPDQKRQTQVLCWWDNNTGLSVKNNGDRGLAKLPCLEPAVIL